MDTEYDDIDELFDSPDEKYMNTLGSVPVPRAVPPPPVAGAGGPIAVPRPIAESRTLPERLYFYGFNPCEKRRFKSGKNHYYLKVTDYGHFGGRGLLSLYKASDDERISKDVKSFIDDDKDHAIKYGDKGECVIKLLPCKNSKKYPQCLKYGSPDLDWFNTVSDWFAEAGVKIDDSEEAEEGINEILEKTSGKMQGITLTRKIGEREKIAKLTGRLRGIGGVGLSIGGKRKRTRKNKGSKKRRKTQKGGKRRRTTKRGSKTHKSRKNHTKKSQKKTLKH